HISSHITLLPLTICILFFLFYCYAAHRDLHSFPTRRSSDLPLADAIEYVQYAEDRGFEAVWQAESRLVRDAIVPMAAFAATTRRSEEHTSELQSRENLVCRLLLEKKKQS